MLSYFRNIKNKWIADFVKKNSQSVRHIMRREMGDIKMLQAKLLLHQLKNNTTINSLHDVEFKVFSQWGDDGIIQYLVKNVPISNNKFIEFGVENYEESNTRFLLKNNNWEGLVIDGSEENIEYIKNDEIYWQHTLTAVHSFVNADNINMIFKNHNFSGKIGLMHIDIDGNDYWIWEAIHEVEADIVIVEYNSIFGKIRPITIPYKADFVRNKYHYSNLYAGASLAALEYLGNKKGYVLIGCNSAGNNAYFVKKEKAIMLPSFSAEDAFVESKFREARNKKGELLYIPVTEGENLIKGMEVINVQTMQSENF